MKYLLSLLLLTLLVSCSEEEVAKSRTCTLNDQPVDCAVLDGTANPSGASGASQLVATATTEYDTMIDRDGMMILLLGEVVDEVVDGDNSCSVDTRGTGRLKYEVVGAGNTLRMHFPDGSTEDFERNRSDVSGDDIIGHWQARATSAGGELDMILTFRFQDNGEVILTNKCFF